MGSRDLNGTKAVSVTDIPLAFLAYPPRDLLPSLKTVPRRSWRDATPPTTPGKLARRWMLRTGVGDLGRVIFEIDGRDITELGY